MESETVLPAVRNNLEHFTLCHAVCTDVGKRRSENQDSYAVAVSKKAALYMVADGMGGARGGAVASAIAVNVIARDAFLPDGTVTVASLKKAIELANAEIFRRSHRISKLAGMGTTVVVFVVVPDGLMTAHTGDSRVYRMRSDSYAPLTRDHSLVRELVDSGAISEAEASSHPIGHMLTRSLGTSEEVKVDIQVLPEPLLNGEKFLLCCDGLYNHVDDREMETALRASDANGAARALLQLALDRGGTDNITVEVIEVFRRETEKIPDSVPLLTEENGLQIVLSSQYDLQSPIEGDRPVVNIDLSQEPSVDENDVRQAGEKPSKKIDVPASDKPIVEGALDSRMQEKLQAKQAGEEGGRRQEQILRLKVVGGAFLAGFLLLYIGWLLVQPPGEDNNEPGLLSVLFSHNDAPTTGTANVTGGIAQVTGQSADEIRDSMFKRGSVSNGTPGNAFVHDSVSVSSLAQTDVADTSTGHDVGEVKRDAGPVVPVPPAVTTGSQSDNSITKDLAPSHDTVVIPATDVVPEPNIVSTLPELDEKDSLAETLSHLLADLEISGDPIDAAIAGVFQFATPPPPPVLGVPDKPTEPINWVAESHNTAALFPETPKEQDSLVPSGRLLGEGEQINMMVSKLELREQIAEADAKLQVLNFSQSDDVKAEMRRVQQEINTVVAAEKEARKRKDAASSSAVDWVSYQSRIGQGDLTGVAAETEGQSGKVDSLRRDFDSLGKDYLSAVQEMESRGDVGGQLASRTASLGRQVQTKRVELEKALNEQAQQMLERKKSEFAFYSTAEMLLDLRHGQLNRHIGFLKAHPSGIPTARAIPEREKILKDRSELVAKLDTLREKMSDPTELHSRMQSARERLEGASGARP